MLSHPRRGGSRIFFRRGCTRLFLYFNTKNPHSFVLFFYRIPVVLENRRSSRGGGGTPCTLPLDPPLPRRPRPASRVDKLFVVKVYCKIVNRCGRRWIEGNRKGVERSEWTNQFIPTSRKLNTNVSFETITPSFSSLYSVKARKNALPRAKIRFFRTPWTHLSYSVLFDNGILKPRCAFFKKNRYSNGIKQRFK